MIKLICPVCKTTLSSESYEQSLICMNDGNHIFPILKGVPVLINDENSVFSISDFIEPEGADDLLTQGMYNSVNDRKKLRGLRSIYRRFAKYLTDFNVRTNRISAVDAIRIVTETDESSAILVVGAGDNRFPVAADHQVVYTDVAIGAGIDFVCDAHDLPFESGSFDLVIAAAVLEHVADPYLVVEEIHRVLKPNGLVYASAPFLQPIHLGAYDFTRWTYTGYRRLFRYFEEVALEPVLGPGSTMAYSIQYFITSFSGKKKLRSLLNLFGLLLSRPFKLLDKVLLKQRSTLGFAAGYGFIGRRSETPLSDRELVSVFAERLST